MFIVEIVEESLIVVIRTFIYCTRGNSILTRKNKLLLLSYVLSITVCEFSESPPSYLPLRLLLNLLLWISELLFDGTRDHKF